MDLSRMGRKVAEVQDEVLARTEPRARAEARLFAPRSRKARLVTFGAAGALALAAAVLLVVRRPPPPAFEVGGAAGEAGAWLAAAGAPLPIRFDDGTAVTLNARARARIVSVDRTGARLLLERGRMEAAVAPQGRRAFRVEAGPFTVRVTGTRFALSWDPAGEALSLEMFEGKVELSGGPLSGARSVSAGETVRLGVGRAPEPAERGPAPRAEAAGPEEGLTRAAEVSREGRPTAHAGAPGAARRGAPEPRVPADPAVPSTARRPAAPPARAVARAAAPPAPAGQDRSDLLLAEGTLEELLAAADAARYAGDTAVARRTLEAVRRRFAGQRDAAVAPFLLGRLAFEGERDFAAAARWFETYLRENPGGPLASEAAGRAIESLRAAGRGQEARGAATRYLQRFPAGPHAGLARSLLEAAP